MYYKRLLWFYGVVVVVVAVASLISTSEDAMVGIMIIPIFISIVVLVAIFVNWRKHK